MSNHFDRAQLQNSRARSHPLKERAHPIHDKSDGNASPNFARAHLKNLRISPYKLNEIAKPIREKAVGDALAILKGMKKRAAEDVSKTLMSAIANAKNNNGLDVDQLVVVEATVGRSMALRRMDIKGRSRSGRITKPFSHLCVIVEQRDSSV